MDVVNQLFQSYLSSTREVSITQTNLAASTSNSICINTDIDEFIYEDNDAAKGEINELDVYMKDKPIRWVDPTGKSLQFDILSWWKANQVTYHILSRLAHDVLAVQVSTVASECAFSSSGRVVSKYRSRLEHETVEALVCTKDWNLASNKDRNDKVEEFVADENEYSSTIEVGQNQADNEGNGEDSEDEGSDMEL